MYWPWRALGYVIAAVCAVCFAFSFSTPVSNASFWFFSILVCGLIWVLWGFKIQKNKAQTHSLVNILHACLGVGLFAALMFAWANLRWQERNDVLIPDAWNETVQMMPLKIMAMPTRTDYGWRMLVKPTDEWLKINPKMPQQMSLSWAEDALPAGGVDALRVGQVWQLPVHVRRPHASKNEGVFDQERYWLAHDIEGMAYVRVYAKTPMEQLPRLLETHWSIFSSIEIWRFVTLCHIDRALVGTLSNDSVGVLKALALGDQSVVSAQQWQLFQDTGITHLVSISGLHVTLLAGMMAWLAQKLWRRSEYLTERIPALHVAQWVGLIGALLYALAAGWGLPAQRTVWMLALWLLLSRLGVARSGLRVLIFSMLWVLMMDPFAVLEVGFWLSYGAVAWLVVAFDPVPQTADEKDEVQGRWSCSVSAVRWLLGLVGAQLGISLSLLPMTLLFFRQASLLGVVVNMLAIPFVSIFLLPLFISVFLLSVLDWQTPIVWVNQVLSWAMSGLQILAPLAQNYRWVGRIEWWQVLLVFVCSLTFVACVRRLWQRVGI